MNPQAPTNQPYTYRTIVCHQSEVHPHGPTVAAAACPAPLLLLLLLPMHQATHPCLPGLLQAPLTKLRLLLLLLAGLCCCSCWPCLPVGAPSQLVACSTTADKSIRHDRQQGLG
jgi:hypothetical protein